MIVGEVGVEMGGGSEVVTGEIVSLGDSVILKISVKYMYSIVYSRV